MTHYLKRLVDELPKAFEILGISFENDKTIIVESTSNRKSKMNVIIVFLLIFNIILSSLTLVTLLNHINNYNTIIMPQ